MAAFQITNGELVKYTGRAAEVIVPEGVTHLRRAFKNRGDVTRVVLPDSVTSIGESDESFG